MRHPGCRVDSAAGSVRGLSLRVPLRHGVCRRSRCRPPDLSRCEPSGQAPLEPHGRGRRGRAWTPLPDSAKWVARAQAAPSGRRRPRVVEEVADDRAQAYCGGHRRALRTRCRWARAERVVVGRRRSRARADAQEVCRIPLRHHFTRYVAASVRVRAATATREASTDESEADAPQPSTCLTHTLPAGRRREAVGSAAVGAAPLQSRRQCTRSHPASRAVVASPAVPRDPSPPSVHRGRDRGAAQLHRVARRRRLRRYIAASSRSRAVRAPLGQPADEAARRHPRA